MLFTTACRGKSEDESVEDFSDGVVNYYIKDQSNLDVLNELAERYSEETGIRVNIQCLTDENYTDAMKTQLEASPDNVTLFDVSDYGEFAELKDYCYDLTYSKVTLTIFSDAFTLKSSFNWEDKENICAVSYSFDSCGIIYNKKLLDKANVDAAMISDFNSLANAVDVVQSKSEALGIRGAFSPAILQSGYTNNTVSILASIPVFNYGVKNGFDNIDASAVDYEKLKNISSLISRDSSASKYNFYNVTQSDAYADFVNERSAFLIGDTSMFTEEMNQKIGYENLGMVPLYSGYEEEEEQGLILRPNAYWCVNKNASRNNLLATLDFIFWCASEEYALEQFKDAGINVPFVNGEVSTNPLVAVAYESIATKKEPILDCSGFISFNEISSVIESYFQ